MAVSPPQESIDEGHAMIFTSPKLLTLGLNTAPAGFNAVVVNRDTISALGPATAMKKKYPGHRIYQLQQCVLMPGLINLHTHLELPALSGVVLGRSFPDWILDIIRAKKKLIHRDYVRAVSVNVNELIHTGTTAVGEISSNGTSLLHLKRSGLRAVVFHEVIQMGAKTSSQFKVQRLPANAPLGRKTSRSSELIVNGLSPHTPYTVSEAFLIQIRNMAMQRKIKLAMHIAESKDEILLLQRKNSGLEKLYRFANWDLAWAPTGRSSFEYLNTIGFLSADLLAVHAVQVTDDDIELIRKSGTSVAHCPRSNKELGVGRMPLKKFLESGIDVGLGTDSLASVPTLNMWDEMRYAYQIHRRDGISAKDIFTLATVGGAKALGLGKEIGTLERGKRADMIAVPLPKKNTGDIYSDLLRETKSCIMTMVNGKILYQE
jgi:cytosine/adenosine deaminase-related metal-dependent hydrolase